MPARGTCTSLCIRLIHVFLISILLFPFYNGADILSCLFSPHSLYFSWFCVLRLSFKNFSTLYLCVCFTVTPTGSGRLMQAAARTPGPRPFTWPASSIPPHHGNVGVSSSVAVELAVVDFVFVLCIYQEQMMNDNWD